MRSSPPKRRAYRLLDAIRFSQAGFNQEHQIHEILDPCVFAILPG
jgi:hypothetical protein